MLGCEGSLCPIDRSHASGREPSVFVSYRRADEPFAAGLLGVALAERFGTDRVFLDTLSLRSTRRFEQELLGRVRSSAVLLALIGSRWDDAVNRARLGKESDWVRREILEAHRYAVRIVPVLVERDQLGDLPEPLRLLEKYPVERLARPYVSADVHRIADRVRTEALAMAPASVSPPVQDNVGLDPETVRRATLAMLRHVLPRSQRRMENDTMMARVVSEQLGSFEWLRFAAAGRSPGRPRGSGIVMVTDEELRVVDVGADLRVRRVLTQPLRPSLELRLVPRKRAWLLTADVHVPGHEDLGVLGMFRAEDEELVETVRRPDAAGTAH